MNVHIFSPCGCRKEVDEAGNITCYRVPGCKGNFPEGAKVIEMDSDFKCERTKE